MTLLKIVWIYFLILQHIASGVPIPLLQIQQSSNGVHINSDNSQDIAIENPEGQGRYNSTLPLPCTFCNELENIIQPALLDYENETTVEILEQLADPETTDIGLPSDTYEVSFRDWIEESDPVQLHRTIQLHSTTQQSAASATQVESLITNVLGANQPSNIRHRNHVRHGSSRLLRRQFRSVGGEQTSNEQVASLALDTLSQNMASLLRNRENVQTHPTGPLTLLEKRDRFNMTVDYQESFQNMEAPQLLEIVLLMRSDCTLWPKRIVRWISGKRGILFECQNGAWVAKYLKRYKKKSHPAVIRDCHEIHLSKDLGGVGKVNKAVITYGDKEQKTFNILCKHNSKHTDHQLIDNRINVNADSQHVETKSKTAGNSGGKAVNFRHNCEDESPQTYDNKHLMIVGAWTLIQRRANGLVKFYRSMKRYKQGFGKFDKGEYWLGLDALHEMTQIRPYMLRIEITTHDNKTYSSEYKTIRVGNEARHYRLKLGAFVKPDNSSLSAGDFMSLHNRGSFHARDSEDFPVNCARLYGTAFWFRGCWAAVNLNGPYVNSTDGNSGVRWATANPDEIRRVWKTEMMIKPILK